MLIYDRLKIVGSLENLRKKSIRKSMKYFFLKMWLDENGTDVADYKSDITINVRDYVRTWMMNPPTLFKNKIKEMITKLIQYKEIGSEQSFLKFLSYQLDRAYLLKNIPFLQFNYDVADIDKLADEIHSEFVGSAGSTLVSLDENINIIIDSISNDEVLYVLSDVLLKREILDSLFYNTKTAKTESKIENIEFVDINNNVLQTGLGDNGYFKFILEGTWLKDTTSKMINSSNGRIKLYTSNIKKFTDGFYIKFTTKPNQTQNASRPILFSFPDLNNNSLFHLELTDITSGILKFKLVSSDPSINNQNTISTNIQIDRIDDKKFTIVWDSSLKIYFDNTLLHEVDLKWNVKYIDNKYIILNSIHSASIQTNDCVSSIVGNVEVGYMRYDGDTPVLTTNDDYSLIFKDIINNFISTAGLFNSKIDAYTDLFTFIKENDHEIAKVKIYNYISNTFYGMNLRYKDSVFNYTSDLEKELSYYVIDVILNSTFDYSKSYYTNENKYAELIGKFKEDLLNEIFFKNINIGNESNSSLSAVFSLQRINEIYNRNNKSFANEPEHFNNALQNLKNIYLNIPILRKSNFNYIFIPEKLNSFFDEFCIYVLWADWLSTNSNTKSAIKEDVNGLVPLEKSTIAYIKPLIEKCIKNNFLTIEEIEPTQQEIKSIYSKVSNFDKSQPIEIQKLNILNNLKLRIESFKYVKFTLNGMTEYEQYKLEFYKYIINLYKTLDQDTINRVAKELNDFYDSL